jgi:chromosome segregation ATPase
LNTSALGGQGQAASALSGGTTSEQHAEGTEEDKSDHKKKRAPLDKQTAFVEYKTQTEAGRQLEHAIIEYREELKSKKQAMKTLTMAINATKGELDNVLNRIAHKQDEKKAANQRGADFDDENEMFG